MKPFTFSFKSEAKWLMAFPLISAGAGLLVVLIVLLIRWLR